MDVWDTYGPKCNSRYLVNYGFTLDNNQMNNTCVVFVDPKEIIPVLNKDLFSEKLAYFNKLPNKNFDDGYSGYSYLIQRKKRKNVRVHKKFRFQLGCITKIDFEHLMNNDLRNDVHTITHQLVGFLRMLLMERKDWDMYMTIMNDRHKLDFYNVLRFVKPLNMDTEIEILEIMADLCKTIFISD